MKVYKLLFLLLLFALPSLATTVSGTIVDQNSATLASGTLTFDLQNCSGSPKKISDSTSVALSTIITANGSGVVAGTIVGNDNINCLNSFYQVTLKKADGKVIWKRNYTLTNAGSWTTSSSVLTPIPSAAFLANPMTTLGDTIIAAGGGVPARLPIGSNGTCLTVSGGVIVWSSCSGLGGGMTNPMTTANDLIVGGSGGAPTRLAIGSNGTCLGVSGGVLGYTTCGSGSVPTGTGFTHITAGAQDAAAVLINLTSSTHVAANQGTVTSVLHGDAAGQASWGQIVNGDITNNTIDLTTKMTGILGAANGGNGNGFFAVSGPATSTKTFTFPNANATVFTSNDQTGTGTTVVMSASPTIVTPTIASFTNAAHNHTNAAGGGALTLASAAFANQGTTATVLHGNAAGNPSFGAVSLTADITGILGAANGGTGNGFAAFSGPATSTKTFTLPNANATILTDNALLTAAQGGTGNGFFLVSGPATSTKTFTFPNANATVFTSNDQTGTGTTVVVSSSPTIVTPTIASFTNATHNHTNAAGGGTLTLAGAAFANQGTTATVLHGNAAGNPTFSAVSLTADITGTLGAGNGGTGNAFTAFSGPATSIKTYTLPNANSTILTDNAAVTIAQGGTGTGSTLAGLVRGSSTAMTAAELSGDATTSGSNAVTVAKVNGVAYTASPSTDTIPVITAANTATYKAVPDCQDSSGNHLNYNSTTHALSCGTTSSGGSATLSSVTDQTASKTFNSSTFNLTFNNNGAVTSGSARYIWQSAASNGSSVPLALFTTASGDTNDVLRAYAQGSTNGCKVDSSGNLICSQSITGNSITFTNLLLNGGGAGSGTLIYPNTGTSGTITVPAATDTLVAKATTDVLTNKTLDAEGTGNVVTIPTRVWFQGAGCQNATARSDWDLPTSTPAVSTCVTGTNTQKGVLAFADTTGGFSAQTELLLPTDFSGNIDANLIWSTTATTGNAKWSVSTICTAVSATETDDTAFNTASTVTTAAPGVASRLQISSITSLTATGCAAGEFLHVKVFRDGNDGADTIAATANLIGLELVIRRTM